MVGGDLGRGAKVQTNNPNTSLAIILTYQGSTNRRSAMRTTALKLILLVLLVVIAIGLFRKNLLLREQLSILNAEPVGADQQAANTDASAQGLSSSR